MEEKLSRKERSERAEKKIQEYKKVFFKVFMDGVKDPNYNYEKTMEKLGRAMRMAMQIKPQEASLIRSAATRLSKDIKQTTDELQRLLKEEEVKK